MVVIVVDGHHHGLALRLRSRNAATTSTPEPSGNPKSTSARLNRTAVTSSSASVHPAASWICEFGNTCLMSTLSQDRSRAGLPAADVVSWRHSNEHSYAADSVAQREFMVPAVRAARHICVHLLRGKRESYHGAVARSRFDKALPCICFARCFMLDMPWPRSSFPSSSIGIPSRCPER